MDGFQRRRRRERERDVLRAIRRTERVLTDAHGESDRTDDLLNTIDMDRASRSPKRRKVKASALN
ncbi:MAG TPA: hypothetical protein VH184_00350 [Dongiaceae bacterium]|jgi:hypothetical protein|nr:hypothetical protein [Dongiaceae bacterium]